MHVKEILCDVNCMVLKLNYVFRYLFCGSMNKSYAYAFSKHVSTERMTIKS